MNNILLIDDDCELAEIVMCVVKQAGHEMMWSPSLSDGLKQISEAQFDVVLLDVRLPDGDGLSLLPYIKGSPPRPEVIVMTGFADPDGAELAIKNGAWDYLPKPVSLDAMKLALEHALEYQAEKRQRMSEPGLSLDREGIVGDSPALRACLDQVADAAQTEITVLVTGETGTGKELFAQAIHRNSPRADKGFVVVDCAALPKTLVESTLFGYERGAYTGADRSREGLVKLADQGSLFLDEIGELPLDVQKKFLRVLQERTFRPVGGKHELKSDFRLIAATNRDLSAMVEEGRFREDLLFRLKAMTIELPPLRERPEDLKTLALHHIRQLCARYQMATKQFSEDFFDVLMEYDWPGNVRELCQSLEKALATSVNKPTIYSKDLPVEVRAKVVGDAVRNSNIPPPPNGQKFWESIPLPTPLPPIRELRDMAVETLNRKYTEALLRQTAGDLEEACRVAGLSRSRIYALISRHSVSRQIPGKPPEGGATWVRNKIKIR